MPSRKDKLIIDKEQSRRQLRSTLMQLPPNLRDSKSRKACQNLIATPQFKKASVVMMYLALPHEVDTRDAILWAWQSGKIVAVPKVSWQQRRMIPVQVNSLESGLATSAYGLRNPVSGLPVPLAEIDLVVTPGLGFDLKGNRLGRGGSYYDRFFISPELKAARCGFAFVEQIMDEVPTVEGDQPLDFLVTDEKVIYFSEQIEQGE